MSSRFLFHLWQKKVRFGACPLFMFHFGLGAWDFVFVLPRLFHKGRNNLPWASILLACMEPCRFGGFAPTNGYIFDLVTGTFPDAMFQHNWWVILMAVATPHKRTPPGRRSKYTWLTCPKTVSVSRIQTIGLSLRPKKSSREAIRHGVLIIRQNRTVEVPWAFLWGLSR